MRKCISATFSFLISHFSFPDYLTIFNDRLQQLVTGLACLSKKSMKLRPINSCPLGLSRDASSENDSSANRVDSMQLMANTTWQ